MQHLVKVKKKEGNNERKKKALSNEHAQGNTHTADKQMKTNIIHTLTHTHTHT